MLWNGNVGESCICITTLCGRQRQILEINCVNSHAFMIANSSFCFFMTRICVGCYYSTRDLLQAHSMILEDIYRCVSCRIMVSTFYGPCGRGIWMDNNQVVFLNMFTHSINQVNDRIIIYLNIDLCIHESKPPTLSFNNRGGFNDSHIKRGHNRGHFMYVLCFSKLQCTQYPGGHY